MPNGKGSLAAFPPAVLVAVKQQAELDAAATGEFLRGLDIEADDDGLIKLPEYTLIGVALALKFRRWELQQIRVHLDAGLLTGAELLAVLMDPSADQIALSKQVTATASKSLELYFESFLWSLEDGSLQADIAIVTQEDEDFLDVITDFLVEQLEGAVSCPAAAR